MTLGEKLAPALGTLGAAIKVDRLMRGLGMRAWYQRWRRGGKRGKAIRRARRRAVLASVRRIERGRRHYGVNSKAGMRRLMRALEALS